MAKAYKCDRCGNTFGGAPWMTTCLIIERRLDATISLPQVNFPRLDFCSECAFPTDRGLLEAVMASELADRRDEAASDYYKPVQA